MADGALTEQKVIFFVRSYFAAQKREKRRQKWVLKRCRILFYFFTFVLSSIIMTEQSYFQKKSKIKALYYPQIVCMGGHMISLLVTWHFKAPPHFRAARLLIGSHEKFDSRSHRKQLSESFRIEQMKTCMQQKANSSAKI